MFSRDEHLFCSFHEFHMILVLRIFERQNFINGFTIMAKQQKQMNITTSLGEVKEFWPQILLFYQTWQVNESFAIIIMIWTDFKKLFPVLLILAYLFLVKTVEMFSFSKYFLSETTIWQNYTFHIDLRYFWSIINRWWHKSIWKI